jgi:signal transduction histidine kinase
LELSAAELALDYFHRRAYGSHYAARLCSIAIMAGTIVYFQIASVAIAIVWALLYVASELVIQRWWARVAPTLGTLSDAAARQRQKELVWFCSLSTSIAAVPFLVNLHPSPAGTVVSIICCAGIIMLLAAWHSMADEMFLWAAPVPSLALILNMIHLGVGVERWLLALLGIAYVVNARQMQASNTAAENTMAQAQYDADRANRAKSTFHDAVTHVDQPIAVFDAEERLVACNQAFADLHRPKDGPAPVLPGKPGELSFADLALMQARLGLYAEGPDEAPVDPAALTRHFHSAREATFRLGDGRWMMVVYRLLPGGARVALWTDVTALKLAETERRVLQEQLHHSQRLDALGRLAGGVAHEINNALVPTIAMTKRVASRLSDASNERRWLVMAQQGAERSRDLVKSILSFSRRSEQRLEPVDLASVLHDALSLMRATLPTTIALDAIVAEAAPIEGDRHQLQQVLVNIITNAAQAIGETQGRIGIGLEPGPNCWQLWIADTGCGMDEATKAQIFEPFFTTKEVGKGTGLGLAVVHGIIRDHGGTIEVESAPGEGARFVITLPSQEATPRKAAE